MQTTMFIRKPLTVEAVQVTADNFYEVAKWCNGDVRTVDGEKVIKVKVIHPMHYKQRVASVTDWILKSEQGFKIYADTAFTNGFTPTGGSQGNILDDLAESLGKGLQFQTPKEV